MSMYIRLWCIVYVSSLVHFLGPTNLTSVATARWIFIETPSEFVRGVFDVGSTTVDGSLVGIVPRCHASSEVAKRIQLPTRPELPSLGRTKMSSLPNSGRRRWGWAWPSWVSERLKYSLVLVLLLNSWKSWEFRLKESNLELRLVACSWPRVMMSADESGLVGRNLP